MDELKAAAEEDAFLQNITKQKAWDAYRALRKGISEGMWLEVPPFPEAQCEATIGGALDAVEALGTSLAGARERISKAIKAEAQEMGADYALEALVMVKSSAQDLPIADWVEACPDPDQTTKSGRRSNAEALLTSSPRSSSRGADRAFTFPFCVISSALLCINVLT